MKLAEVVKNTHVSIEAVEKILAFNGLGHSVRPFKLLNIRMIVGTAEDDFAAVADIADKVERISEEVKAKELIYLGGKLIAS